MVNEFFLLHALEADNKYVSNQMQRKLFTKIIKKIPKIYMKLFQGETEVDRANNRKNTLYKM